MTTHRSTLDRTPTREPTAKTDRATPDGCAASSVALGSALIPPTSLVRRRVRKIIPGWPQAWWQLTCGHHITVPTWATGRTSPNPKRELHICHKCENARWRKWFDRHEAAWAAVHGDDWYKLNNEVKRGA